MSIRKVGSKFSIPRLRRDDGDDDATDPTKRERPRRVFKAEAIPVTDTLPSGGAEQWGAPKIDIEGVTTPSPVPVPIPATRSRFAIPRAASALAIDEVSAAPTVTAPNPEPMFGVQAYPRTRERFAIPRTADAPATSAPVSTVLAEDGAFDQLQTARPRFALPTAAAPEPTTAGYGPDTPTDVTGVARNVYEPGAVESRKRIADPRTFIEERVAEEDVEQPVNRNSRAMSALKTGGKTFLRSLRAGHGILPSAFAALFGTARGAIDKTADERINLDEHRMKDRRTLAQMDVRDEARLKRAKTIADIQDIGGRAAGRRQDAYFKSRDDLLQQIGIRKYYKKGENPALDAQLADAELPIGDFDNRASGSEKVPVIGPDGKTYNVTPSAALEYAKGKKADDEKVEVTLSDGRKIKVSPATAASTDAMKENRQYERGREQDKDTAEATALQEEARIKYSDSDFYNDAANKEAELANQASTAGDDNGLFIHTGEANRLRTLARDLRRDAQAAEAKAKSKPSPIRYRPRSGGATYNVPLGKYGLEP